MYHALAAGSTTFFMRNDFLEPAAATARVATTAKAVQDNGGGGTGDYISAAAKNAPALAPLNELSGKKQGNAAQLWSRTAHLGRIDYCAQPALCGYVRAKKRSSGATQKVLERNVSASP